MALNGNSDETNGYNSVAKNGELSNVNFIKSMVCPIGTVVSWLKTFTNTPTLPDGWVECDGGVLSDSDSPYNGQTLPDLNGGIFLRGDTTSGGTGGSATMAHTHTTALETDGGNFSIDTNRSTDGANESRSLKITTTTTALTNLNRFNTSSASNAENRPPFYNVVWIMRVK